MYYTLQDAVDSEEYATALAAVHQGIWDDFCRADPENAAALQRLAIKQAVLYEISDEFKRVCKSKI